MLHLLLKPVEVVLAVPSWVAIVVALEVMKRTTSAEE